MIRFLPLLCLLVLSSSWMNSSLPAAEKKQNRPNIVLILSDDQSWTDFGFMEHPDIETPHLDQLIRKSALYPNGYVPTSLCRPSLATLISGQYPHQHGITGNDPPKGTDRQKMLKHIDQMPKLPKLLAQNGYVSFQSGKWWEGAPARAGFTAGMTHGDPQKGGRHGDLGLKIGRTGMDPIFDFIDSQTGNPFFIWYAPFLPHTPHTPPERLLQKYKKPNRPIELAKYYAMCEWFDETCGQLTQGLEDRHLTEQTLILFVTDNGWIQRTPQTSVPEKWRFKFAPKSKRSPHDGGLRTPIFLSWPGTIDITQSNIPVSSIDLVPTILDAAGIPKPDSMPGHSLLSFYQNKKQFADRPLFGEIFEHDVADIDNPAASLLYRWCRFEDWKLILPNKKEEPVELYYLTTDPHEKQNLATQEPDKVQQLTKLINQWWDGKEIALHP